MTDEKAKEILDFLARRAGYSRFVVKATSLMTTNKVENLYIASIVGRKSSYYNQDSSYLLVETKKSTNYKFDYIYGKSIDNYMQVLNKIFNASSRGCKIETKFVGEVFLPANCTLEQILVEMDLEKEA